MSNAPLSPGPDGTITPLSLLERARRQDAVAWERLMGLYRPLVLYWCRRGGLAVEDAEDVTQEVFTSVSAHLGEFRRDRPDDTFRGWLRVITRNQLRMHHRRTEGKPRGQGGSAAWRDLEEIADATAEPGEEERVQLGEVYRRALELVRGEFEPRTWQAFCLSILDGRSTDAAAAELAMSVAAVRQAKSRILRRVKQEVGDLIDC
jgi:RNA polymerase sigma-70 factor (ECF subfamily)